MKQLDILLSTKGTRMLLLSFLLALLPISMSAQSTNINFADAAVKAICVANWDTNGDGELSYAEAAAVTDLGESFKDNSEIASFDELQYFTGLTSIGDAAFNGCSGLTSVTISESVTSIGSRAFQGCAGLTSVTIPESVTSIGAWAFQNCTGLTSITIPKDLTSISMGMFCDCSGLTSVTIPEGVTSIGYYVFEGCAGLTSVTIPSSVTNINPFAFARCLGLTSVTSLVQEPFEIYSSVFNEIDWTTVTLYVPVGTKEKYEATPAWNQFQNIVEIENMNQNIVFADAAVKAICVANWDTNGDGELNYDEAAAVTDLGNAFINNSEITSFDELQYFTEMTNIGSQAFKGCTQLKNIAIPTSVTSIDEQAFYECTELSSINLPLGLTNIGSLAFGNCISLINITIPEGVRCIGGAAFFACRSLTSVTIPTSVTDIGANPFQFCDKLSTILVEEENPVYDSRESCNAIILTREDKIISGCMDSVIPNTVRTIGQVAFWGSGLAAISIPNSVTTVESNSFRYNFNLTSVTIPNSVTSIGYNAFFGCTGLVTVTSLIEEPFEIFSDVFTYWNFETDAEEFTTATLYVPVGTKEKYMATPAWNQFQNIALLIRARPSTLAMKLMRIQI